MKAHSPKTTDLISIVERAALQFLMLEQGEYDRLSGDDIYFAVDDNLPHFFLDPASHAVGGHGEAMRLGAGDVALAGQEFSTEISAKSAQHIFFGLHASRPNLILSTLEAGFAKMSKAIRNAVVRGNLHEDNVESAFIKALIEDDIKSDEGIKSTLDKILFLESTNLRKLQRLGSLKKSKRIGFSSIPESLGGFSTDIVDLIQEADGWSAYSELYEYEKLFQSALISIKYAGSSTRAAKICSSLARIAWLNDRARQSSKLSKVRFVFITLDSRVIDICELVSANIISRRLSSSTETSHYFVDEAEFNFSNLYVRHPRAFLGAENVLGPEPEKKLGLIDMYRSLLSPFYKHSALEFKMRDGKVVLTDSQKSAVARYAESESGDPFVRFSEFSDEFNEYLKVRVDFTSDVTMTRLEQLSSQEPDDVISSLQTMRDRVHAEYTEQFVEAMASSLDAFSIIQTLRATELPPRNIVNISVRGTQSIQNFIELCETVLFMPRSDHSTVDWNSIYNQYDKLIEDLRPNPDSNLYSFALAHAYAFALIGEWEASAISARLAIGCTGEFDASQADVKEPNGREAYFYLSYSYRHTAKTNANYQECARYLNKAQDIFNSENGSIEEKLAIVPERFDSEMLALNISKLLSAYHKNEMDMEASLSGLSDIIDRVDRFVNSVLKPEISKYRTGQNTPERYELLNNCYIRGLSNIIALGIQFPELRESGLQSWQTFRDEVGMNEKASYFRRILIAIGEIVYDNTSLTSKKRKALRELYEQRGNQIVFPYDRKRYEEMFKQAELEGQFSLEV